MAKNYGSRRVFAFVSRFLCCCLVIVVVGPTFNTAQRRSEDPKPNVTSVTPPFGFINCPVWVGKELQSVFFVDDIKQLVIRYEPDTGNTFSVETQISFTFLVPVKTDQGSKFVGGVDYLITLFGWDGTSNKITVENSLKPFDSTYEIFQCAKSDIKGRLWLGTSSSETSGKLYMVDVDGTITVKLDNVGVPYAIAFSPDCSRLYLADMTDQMIVAYPFDIEKGSIQASDRLVIFDFTAKKITCTPKGMTVDVDGHLWAACYGTNYVLKINTVDSKIITQVDFPEAYIVNSVGFGSAELQDLYVTAPRNVEHPEKYPKSGTLFRVTGMVSKGTEDFQLEVNWPKQ